MAKEKKISIRKWEALVKKTEPSVLKFSTNSEEGSVEVSLKKKLNFYETLGFVNDVAEMCFVEGVYSPAMFDFAFKVEVLNYYTNLNIETSVDKLWSLVYASDVIHDIIDVIAEDYYELRDVCSEAIKVRKDEKKSNVEELSGILIEFVDDMKHIADGTKSMVDDGTLESAINSVSGMDGKEIVNNILEFKKRDDE